MKSLPRPQMAKNKNLIAGLVTVAENHFKKPTRIHYYKKVVYQHDIHTRQLSTVEAVTMLYQ